jgi:hypothetical protein
VDCACALAPESTSRQQPINSLWNARGQKLIGNENLSIKEPFRENCRKTNCACSYELLPFQIYRLWTRISSGFLLKIHAFRTSANILADFGDLRLAIYTQMPW